MKERPILFSAPMVRAILAGRKTQTRRVVKGCPARGAVQPLSDGSWEWSPDGGFDHGVLRFSSRYGGAGDRLWVRETWAVDAPLDQVRREREDAMPPQFPHGPYFCADAVHDNSGLKWRPSIHMPRWACRLVLEVTGVRIERLHDLNESDAQAEGCRLIGEEYANFPNDGPNKYTVDLGGHSYNQPTAKQCFSGLWQTINGEASWNANPWVWVVEFKRLALTAD